MAPKRIDYEHLAKVRQEFEAWAKSLGFELEMCKDIDGSSRYVNFWLEARWAGWYAATMQNKKAVDQVWAANERDRSIVIDAYNAISDTIARRSWLLTSRGSYEWDDERYQLEFGAALEEIEESLKVLNRIGINWDDCPKDNESIQNARIDWRARAEAAETALRKYEWRE